MVHRTLGFFTPIEVTSCICGRADTACSPPPRLVVSPSILLESTLRFFNVYKLTPERTLICWNRLCSSRRGSISEKRCLKVVYKCSFQSPTPPLLLLPCLELFPSSTSFLYSGWTWDEVILFWQNSETSSVSFLIEGISCSLLGDPDPLLIFIFRSQGPHPLPGS